MLPHGSVAERDRQSKTTAIAVRILAQSDHASSQKADSEPDKKLDGIEFKLKSGESAVFDYKRDDLDYGGTVANLESVAVYSLGANYGVLAIVIKTGPTIARAIDARSKSRSFLVELVCVHPIPD